MSERYFQHTFKNGLTLLCERMPEMTSAGMTLLVPAGAATDRPDALGTATVLSDLVLRGAGKRDNRQLTEFLDGLGLQRSTSTGMHHTRFGAAAVADKVLESLSAYADIVRRPVLPEVGFEPARDLALQALEGIDDDPRQKLMILLRQWHFPSPLGRNIMGEAEHLKKLTLPFMRDEFGRRYHAGGAILALAGNIEFAMVKDEVERLFGDWHAHPLHDLQLSGTGGKVHHETQDSEQTHIGVAYPGIVETDERYYIMRLGIEVLSGGMSGRLFTEIREKRALCYSVWAGYSGSKEAGAIMGYAGSSNDRAQATLDCLVFELRRLGQGITQAELDRARTGLKANTIMQGESTSARAGAIAHDFYVRGRIRTLDEIKSAIDSVTLDQVNDFLKQNPLGQFTVVTVGPKPLTTPV